MVSESSLSGFVPSEACELSRIARRPVAQPMDSRQEPRSAGSRPLVSARWPGGLLTVRCLVPKQAGVGPKQSVWDLDRSYVLPFVVQLIFNRMFVHAGDYSVCIGRAGRIAWFTNFRSTKQFRAQCL